MMESIFDGNCCHNAWDDSLDGKLCFFANELVHVYLGDLLVVCIGRHEGHHYTVEECLFTLYSTLEVVERYYDNVK